MTHYAKSKSERPAASKTRPCLVCKAPFQSEWSGERICRRCKSGKNWSSGIGTSKFRRLSMV
jgi:hypothetical protein